MLAPAAAAAAAAAADGDMPESRSIALFASAYSSGLPAFAMLFRLSDFGLWVVDCCWLAPLLPDVVVVELFCEEELVVGVELLMELFELLSSV